MILYTPLSETDVFPVEEENVRKRTFATMNGRTVYIEQLDNGSYEVLQLLSTDPKDFLDESFMPGTIVNMD